MPAALAVLAVGVRSNTGFLEGSDIAVNQGIVVDRFLRTTAPDVYAAGDCCEGLDISTGKPDMLAIQPVAVEQGGSPRSTWPASPRRTAARST